MRERKADNAPDFSNAAKASGEVTPIAVHKSSARSCSISSDSPEPEPEPEPALDLPDFDSAVQEISRMR